MLPTIHINKVNGFCGFENGPFLAGWQWVTFAVTIWNIKSLFNVLRWHTELNKSVSAWLELHHKLLVKTRQMHLINTHIFSQGGEIRVSLRHPNHPPVITGLFLNYSHFESVNWNRKLAESDIGGQIFSMVIIDSEYVLYFWKLFVCEIRMRDFESEIFPASYNGLVK